MDVGCVTDWRTNQWHPADGQLTDVIWRGMPESAARICDSQQHLRRRAWGWERALRCK